MTIYQDAEIANSLIRHGRTHERLKSGFSTLFVRFGFTEESRLQTEALIEPMDAPKCHRYDLLMRLFTRPYHPEMRIRIRIASE